MGNLFKTFGKGILYIIGFPFFILALVIFGVVGLFLFIFQLFKAIFYFFSGQKFFPELPEDKQLRLQREAALAASNPQPTPVEEANPAPQPAPQPMPAPFVEEKPIFEEEPLAQPVQQEYQQPQEQKPVFEEEPVYQEPVKPAPAQEEAPKRTVHFNKYNSPEDPFQPEKKDTIDTSSEPEKEKEEVLEEYVPGGSSFSDSIDDDDEDTNNGVDINYDV